MSLKLKLENLDGIDESLHALYKEVDGEFVLQVEGLDSDSSDNDDKSDVIKKMEAKISKLFNEKGDLKKLLSEKDSELKEQHKADENYKALYEQSEKELEALRADNAGLQKENENLVATNRSEKLQAKVTDIASRLSGEKSPLMKLVIEKRLGHDEDGNVIVLGEDGKPSKLTIEELQNEIKSNDLYSGLILGTKANGGGAEGSTGSPGAKEKEVKTDRDSRLTRMSSYHKSSSVDNLTAGFEKSNERSKDPLI